MADPLAAADRSSLEVAVSSLDDAIDELIG